MELPAAPRMLAPQAASRDPADLKPQAHEKVTRLDGDTAVVRVYEGLVAKVIDGDPDRLAYILGHELGHILKKHPLADDREPAKTLFTDYAFTRDQEYEAARVGAELLLKAGFSLEKALRAVTVMRKLGLEHAGFDSPKADHPSWNDRAARPDREKVHPWRAMAAFDNGVIFLTAEQYGVAEVCFEKTTREFPGCHEAWANPGIARLMEYCDKLQKEDLEGYGIGQVVAPGFYRRAGAGRPDERREEVVGCGRPGRPGRRWCSGCAWRRVPAGRRRPGRGRPTGRPPKSF